MKKVYICSPLKGDGSQEAIEQNMTLARKYARLAFAEGCVPLVPHIYFPTFLDESNPDHRAFGLSEGLAWLRESEELWVCADSSTSVGMAGEIAEAVKLGIPIRYRYDHPFAE